MRSTLTWSGLGLAALIASSGCEREATRATASTSQPLRAAPLRAAVPSSSSLPERVLAEHASSACPDVERQARELGAALPRQLDADTRATRVTANGCDLRLEYELSTLSARDVSERGLRAMRGAVIDRLCSDKGALAVMQRGGRFTNVYTDRAQAPIGLFTVAADDCGI